MSKARELAAIVTSLSQTEIGYLDGVTSSVQTQLDGKSATSHNHDGIYEPADATIVKDADIGVTVQAYNANLVTYATNGNTAYGWGDHASASYATTTALSTAVANSSNWDTAYGWGDHASQGYLTNGFSITSGTLTTANVTTLDLGDWTVVQSGTTLDFNYSGSTKFSISSAGAIIAADNVTAYGTP